MAASGRTTIILGTKERRAASRLAVLWDVSPSEAIRRALLKVEDLELEGARTRRRARRLSALDRAAQAFRGTNVKAELARIAEERDAW